MKLDITVINKIVEDVDQKELFTSSCLREYLKTLDLVIKSGDSSQGTLVENLTKGTGAVNNPYFCKDCGNEIYGNYVTAHFDCTDIHPNDRKSK